jgi:hypothetical protein
VAGHTRSRQLCADGMITWCLVRAVGDRWVWGKGGAMISPAGEGKETKELPRISYSLYTANLA